MVWEVISQELGLISSTYEHHNVLLHHLYEANFL